VTAAADRLHTGATAPADVERALAREARLLTQYLVGHDCPDHLIDRYVRGHEALQQREPSAMRDDGVAAFAMRYPFVLPLLDAAAAVTHRGDLLRWKLRLMTAVLETSPDFVAAFRPTPSPRVLVLLRLARYALVSAAKAMLGLPLLLLLRRGRDR